MSDNNGMIPTTFENCLTDDEFRKILHLIKIPIPGSGNTTTNNNELEQQQQSLVGWPCLKINSRDFNIDRILLDRSLFTEDIARQVVVDLVGLHHREKLGLESSICILLGNECPNNSRIIADFTSIDHIPEEERTLFRFDNWSIVFLCHQYMLSNEALQKALRLVDRKLRGTDLPSTRTPFHTNLPTNAATAVDTMRNTVPSAAVGREAITTKKASRIDTPAIRSDFNANDLLAFTMQDTLTDQQSLHSVQRRLLPTPGLDEYTLKNQNGNESASQPMNANDLQVDEESNRLSGSKRIPSTHLVDRKAFTKRSKRYTLLNHGATPDEPMTDIGTISGKNKSIEGIDDCGSDPKSSYENPATPKVALIETQKEFDSSSEGTKQSKKQSNNSFSKFSRRVSIDYVDGKSSFKVPGFKEVRDILTKAGYVINTRSTPWRFDLPTINTKTATELVEGKDYFNTESKFRDYLCAYGLNLSKAKLNEKELSLLETWVRGAVIKSIRQPQTSSQLKAVNITNKEALKILKELGFKYSDQHQGYIFPNIESNNVVEGTNLFTVDKSMFQYLARFGIPSDSAFDQASDLLSLEVFLARNVELSLFNRKDCNHVELYKDDVSSSASTAPHRRSRSCVKLRLTTTCRKEPTRNRSSVTIGKPVKESDNGSRRSRTKSQAKTKRCSPRHTTTDDNATHVTCESTLESGSMSASVTIQSDSSSQENSNTTGKTSYSLMDHCLQVSLPSFSGSNQEVLRDCLQNLSMSYKSNDPTYDLSKSNSKFASNLERILNFLQDSFEQKGNGIRTTSKAGGALYVCGIPGVGKTSGVRMCCAQFQNFRTRDNLDVPTTCFINAGHVAKMSQPIEYFLEEISVSLKVGKSITTMEQLNKTLKSQALIMIVDEVDMLVSGNRHNIVGKLSASESVLRTFVELANDSKLKFVFIGISNCINDNKSVRIHQVGVFNRQVIFNPYGEEELMQILEARVGKSVFSYPALTIIAKKVAKSSGDARKAIEMASNAARLCLEQEMNIGVNHTTPHPLVTMKHFLESNNETDSGIRTKIDGLPMLLKISLSILTTLAEVDVKAVKLESLRGFSIDCMTSCDFPFEYMSLEDFACIIDTLSHTGLLLARKNFSHGVPSNELPNILIRLGVQMTEVNAVLEKDLTQPIFSKVREFVKNHRNEIR